MTHSAEDQPGGQLVPAPPPKPHVDLNDPLTDLDGAFRIAQLMAQSSMVPQALRGSPQNCLICMLLGRELGLSYIQAIRGIYVLPSGQPGLRGALILARIRTAGHRYKFDRTDESCTCTIYRKDEEFKTPYEGVFTVEDAKAANLVTERDGKLVARSRSGEPLPWEQYRREMLQWRAVARAAGIAVPELVFGFDIAGIGDAGDEAAPPPPAGPAPRAAADTAPVEILAKLEQLDRQRSQAEPDSQSTAEPAEHEGAADYDVTAPAPAARDERERPEGLIEGSGRAGKPAQRPSWHTLSTAMATCGHRGAKAARAASALTRHDVDKLSELTPGEVLMAYQAVIRIVHTADDDQQRFNRLEELAQRERDAWAEAEEPAQ